jgi:hypothetical protein
MTGQDIELRWQKNMCHIGERTKRLGVLWAGEDLASSSEEVPESKMSKSQESVKRNKKQKVVLNPQTVIPKRS